MHRARFFCKDVGPFIFFFPEGNRYFRWGGGVSFLHAPHFGAVNAPRCLAMGGGGTAQLGVPTAAGDFGLRSLQLPKGDRPPAPVG